LQLTLISAFPSEVPKYRDIVIPELQAFKGSTCFELILFFNAVIIPCISDSMNVGFEMTKLSKLQTISMITNWQKEMAKMIFNNGAMKKFMNDELEKFDLVIIEYFMTEYLLG